ncbi:MAG: SDR family oxidoreductase, partial [Candidatus Methanomethylophilaceae archaeon]|nr:SDR family oxidoreductase [Candidatus Methanomethylophilaceae archaeon]
KILLTGGTGYLGSHVLFELLRRNAKKIYCLVRSGRGQSSEERLRSVFMYYFGGMIGEDALDRVTVIDGDVTDQNLAELLGDCEFDTIINCAAVVKHFAADDSIERVNVGGVENLIRTAKEKGAVLVQISTESVAGESVNGSIPEDKRMKETELDFGQNLDNKYAHSKFMAEKAVISAMSGGLSAKIIRVGNLMSRDSDGEFQINFNTNSFMKQMKSYVKLGFFSVTDMDTEVEFSPIDMVAKAVVVLAGTPEKFTAFHVNNCHKVHMANVLKVMRDNGMPVEVVSRRVFEQRFAEALKDESKGEYVSGLISYLGNAGESRRFVAADETYTVRALYRLGFSWPIITEEYIDKAFKALKAMRFFK